jgi:hypothetical protein
VEGVKGLQIVSVDDGECMKKKRGGNQSVASASDTNLLFLPLN